jgi:hypothetical protein
MTKARMLGMLRLKSLPNLIKTHWHSFKRYSRVGWGLFKKRNSGIKKIYIVVALAFLLFGILNFIGFPLFAILMVASFAGASTLIYELYSFYRKFLVSGVIVGALLGVLAFLLTRVQARQIVYNITGVTASNFESSVILISVIYAFFIVLIIISVVSLAFYIIYFLLFVVKMSFPTKIRTASTHFTTIYQAFAFFGKSLSLSFIAYSIIDNAKVLSIIGERPFLSQAIVYLDYLNPTHCNLEKIQEFKGKANQKSWRIATTPENDISVAIPDKDSGYVFQKIPRCPEFDSSR